MNKTIFRALSLTAILATLVVGASAQRKYAVKKTLTFKRGASPMRIVSTLASNLEVNEYYFEADAGKRMTVDLVSNNKNISFYIMSQPDGDCITRDIAVRGFDNTLPDTGEYKLIVSTDTRRGAKYV